jgi:Fur family transcriptional regulator, ferric uptake regulator
MMCGQCDYRRLLQSGGLDPTPKRLWVLEVIGANSAPVSAQEVFETVSRSAAINRVTVYRILDLLAARGLVERLSGSGRSQVYGLAPNENHPAHPHFYCRSCGTFECLLPESLNVDLQPMQRTFAGRIENVAVRVEGRCKKCLKDRF